MIKAGDTAPDFVLRAQDGMNTALADLLERKKALVLVFYVFDFSPV